MDCYSIVLCESSTVWTQEDCRKSEVKLGAVILRVVDCGKTVLLANPLQLFLLHAITFVSIASLHWSLRLRIS